MRKPVHFAAAAVLIAATGWSQPYGTDILYATQSFTPPYASEVHRLSAGGKTSTMIANLPPAMPVGMTMANDNRSVVIIYGVPSTPQLVLADPVRGAIVWTVPLPGPPSQGGHVAPTGDGGYLVSGYRSLMRLSPSLLLTTVITYSQGYAARAVHDLHTGGYAVVYGVAPNVGFLDSVSPQGQVLTSWPLPPWVGGLSLGQDHRDGSFVLSYYFRQMFQPIIPGLVRMAPGGPVTTIRTWEHLTVAFPVGLTVDRASGDGEFVVSTTNMVLRIDGQGSIVSTALPPLPPWTIAFDRSQNLVGMRLGALNQYRFDLSFPRQPSRAYVLGLSASGFTPGIPLGGGRAVQLVPDAVLAAAVTGQLYPLLQGQSGFLDPSGSAVASLDLNAFGTRLTGTRLWAVALTLDPAAPRGVGEISKPIVIVLR